MEIVVISSKGRVRQSALSGEETPLISFACWPGIDLIVKARVLNVDFLWIDTYNGPILFVQ